MVLLNFQASWILLLGVLDLGHTIFGNVEADNVLDERPVEVSGSHVFTYLVDG